MIRFEPYRTTPRQRVSCVTPPTAQRTRISVELPAAAVPLARKWSAVVRTVGTLPCATAGGVHKPVVQTFRSSQLRGPPRQAPAVQVSPTVQTLPSVHAIPLLRLTKPQAPAPLQALLVQTVAAAHGEPSGSKLQTDEQQSPFSLLPSSHCSACRSDNRGKLT